MERKSRFQFNIVAFETIKTLEINTHTHTHIHTHTHTHTHTHRISQNYQIYF